MFEKLASKLRILALSACGLFLLTTAASAQVTAVEGVVKGQDGNPIAGAVIKFERKDIKGTYQDKTNKKGHYGYYGLPLGTYKISVLVDGKERDYVDNVRTSLGDPKVMNFDLKASAEQAQALAKAAETGTLTKEQERGMTAAQKAALDAQTKERQKVMAKNKALNDAFNAGMEAMKNKQYDTAVTELQKAADMDQTQAVIYSNLADAYLNEAIAKPDQADDLRTKGYDAWKKAIELKPDDAGYLNNYGLALSKAKKTDEATQILTKAAQMDPQYYFNLGAILMNAGKVDDAAAAFKKETEVEPTKAEAYYQYAVALVSKAQLGKDGKIIPAPGTKEALEKYLELAPNGPNAASAKGILSTMEGSVATTYANPSAEKTTGKKKK